MTEEKEKLKTINFSLFKDSLAAQILFLLSTSEADSEREDVGHHNNMVADLDDSEFATYLASEVWPALPQFIRKLVPRDGPSSVNLNDEKTLTPRRDDLKDKKKSKKTDSSNSSDLPDANPDVVQGSVDPEDIEFQSLPPEFVDSLLSYNILPTSSENNAQTDLSRVHDFLRDILASYIPLATTRDRSASTGTGQTEEGDSGRQKDECEICERVVPLTRHHLVPRVSAAKAIKRGWQEETDLTRYAWTCRPCHSMVHRVASTDELARLYHTVPLLLEREDIQRWRNYASRQRWGVKRG